LKKIANKTVEKDIELIKQSGISGFSQAALAKIIAGGRKD
jgi:hypothetical protein